MDQRQLASLSDLLLSLVPEDGSAVGNQSLREQFLKVAAADGFKPPGDLYDLLRDKLVKQCRLEKGKGRGGSVRRAAEQHGLDLDVQPVAAPVKPTLTPGSSPRGRGEKTPSREGETSNIISYRHLDRRKNNPEVGVVNEATDPAQPQTALHYDPHLDPALQFDVGRAAIEKLIDDALASANQETMQFALEELKRLQSPYLNWAGKAERTSFAVDTVSLHVHERIDPMSILAAVRNGQLVGATSSRDRGREAAPTARMTQPGLFEAPFESLLEDFPAVPVTNFWADTQSGSGLDKVCVVQTSQKIIERCLLMTTDPGDLVLDPTCGSGTTAFVAEKCGRRWITCDTSRVAVTLAKQRLMTASFDYFELRYPHEGLKGGFIYKTVPHVTLKSIANNPEIDEIYERMNPAVEKALAALNVVLVGAPLAGAQGQAQGLPLHVWTVPFDFPSDWPESAQAPFDEFHRARQAMQKQMDYSIASHADSEILYDQPQSDKKKLRITGPFTVEAVPFPTVLALDEAEQPQEADVTIARSGESSRQHQSRDELLKTGIRGKGGQMPKFAELNDELLEQFHGTVSLPFEAGDNRKVAVKVVDDRGIESLKIIVLED